MTGVDRTEPALDLLRGEAPLVPGTREDLVELPTSLVLSLQTLPDRTCPGTRALLRPDGGCHRALTGERTAGVAPAHAEHVRPDGCATTSQESADVGVDVREVRAPVVGVVEAMHGPQALRPGHTLTVGEQGISGTSATSRQPSGPSAAILFPSARRRAVPVCAARPITTQEVR